MSLNFGQISLLTTELAALERLKNRCRHFFSVTIDQIRLIAIDQIYFKFVDGVSTLSRLFRVRSFWYLQVMRTCIKAWMSSNFGQIPLLTWELAALERLKNRCCHIFSVAIDKIHFKFVGNEDIHNILHEFEFRPDWTTDYGVSCPWASKKYPHRFIMGKMVFPLFLCCFWLDPFDTPCNKNRH